MEKITVENSRKCCVLCHRSTVDELNLGPLYSRGKVICHYFCILFVSNLQQRGKSDEDGILGFLTEDITDEIERVSKPHLSKIYTCAYCDEKNPTIGCCNGRCKKVWHFPCGLEAGATSQFFGNHESFCSLHAKPKPKYEGTGRPECSICLRKVAVNDTSGTVFGSCCKRASFHKDCIQQYAKSAGYFFKCPCCTNKEEFTRDVQRQGVFVPNQDAAWELEPQAFQELLFTHNKCDASVCECPKGREYVQEKGPWRLFRCTDCGAAATHVKCENETKREPWYCLFCRETEKNLKNKRLKLAGTSTATTNGKAGARRTQQQHSTTRRAPTRTNFAKIKIADHCKDYFPFDQKQMIQFGREPTGFPDWSMRKLRINLVDCLGPKPSKPGQSPKSSE